MKWEMEMEEIEAILEKIWDLHDKLSDAIHSISRTHFLNSIQTLKATHRFSKKSSSFDDNRCGYVFVKDIGGVVVEEDDGDNGESAIFEAKSLNAIRTALENLEDQLEFYHTVHIQQRAERDAAIARLEQSRIVLAMRLADHHGKNYKVIEEALAFVGDVHSNSCFVSPENLYASPESPSGKNSTHREKKKSNPLIRFIVSSFDIARKALKLEGMGGILGNAALVTLSMLALLHIHQISTNNKFDSEKNGKNMKRASRPESHLDVLLARG